MRSEPLNNCHSDEVTPIASSHSALIFSSCCTAVPSTFTFTVHSSSGMSSLHSALKIYRNDISKHFRFEFATQRDSIFTVHFIVCHSKHFHSKLKHLKPKANVCSHRVKLKNPQSFPSTGGGNGCVLFRH